MIRPSKEEGARIRAAAAASGKSVQAFILGVLREKIGIGPDTGNTDQNTEKKEKAES